MDILARTKGTSRIAIMRHLTGLNDRPSVSQKSCVVENSYGALSNR